MNERGESSIVVAFYFIKWHLFLYLTVTAIYRSSNPEHLKPEWTARLWKQIPEVARGTKVSREVGQ